MARLPEGAVTLTLEEALRYFPQGSAEDRDVARAVIERVGVTDFYAPPSGGYVGCHGGVKHYGRREAFEPVNGVLLRAGSVVAYPNEREYAENFRLYEVIPLSGYRGDTSREGGDTGPVAEGEICPTCFVVLPATSVCDQCD